MIHRGIALRPASWRRQSVATLIVLALVLLAMPWRAAGAHQAPSGWAYPPACCGTRDCAPAPPPRVSRDQDGNVALVWRLRPGQHPMVRDEPVTIAIGVADPRIEASGDGEWHLCLRAYEPRVICVFRPPAGF
ncbi:MAG: hypothetical protein N2483_03970 [Burkholderiaceae bacterium]|nr:hypothetical protein [Burkholderiaceae bacterium]